MNTQEMLEALSVSPDTTVRKIATDILQGIDTIENQKTVCGKFLQNVFDGKCSDAFRVATNANKLALVRWLIQKDRQSDADHLIKQNFFRQQE